MKRHHKTIYISALLVLISFVCYPQGTLPPPAPPPPVGLPIDGGILASIGLAIFYGARKLIRSKK